ncbi:hypothetical protein LTR09_012088 [Extremus antarcticus]|uniref:Uncharacterized protein n=1 Tax=Extremus antarcticus TaxID=702011 RepID=A0AAJ0D593_9PEZI|nr:hypothetical protein LTR09_012088 [Extremus antarcticus]
MAPFNPFVASWNFTRASDLTAGVRQFLVERSITLNYIEKYWDGFVVWLSQPTIFYIIIAWAVTFTIIMITVLSLGFGPIGVVAGSTAAAFQAWMYGGFTPGAGIFATLTSLGMLGLMMPAAVTFAACIATVVAWAYGVGA